MGIGIFGVFDGGPCLGGALVVRLVQLIKLNMYI